MTHHKQAQLIAFASLAFGQGQLDAFRMEEPRIGSSICGITSMFAPRGVLRAPEGEGGDGGGGDKAKTFKQEDVDRIVQERVAGMKKEVETLKASVADLDALKTKLAEAESEREKATEAEALKGKTELEKLQHQLSKQAKTYETEKADLLKKQTELEAREKAAVDKHTTHVRTSAITTALRSAGLAKDVDDDAVYSFLREAQIEAGEDAVSIARLTVGGKAFDKVADAAAHFLKQKPHFAAPPAGGSGNPRGPNGAPPTSDVSKSSADDDFAIGMSKI